MIDEETRHNRSPQPNLVKIGLGWGSDWVLVWVGGEVGLGWLESCSTHGFPLVGVLRAIRITSVLSHISPMILSVPTL